jgi:DNA polymerase III delta prime subunit
VKTYTEDELRAAVEAAVGDLRGQIDSLRASQEASEIEARIATAVGEATEPLSAQVTELQTKLDASVIEAQNEKARADGLEAEKVAAAEAATLAARKDERVAKVAEVANFPKEYLDANAERFAAMSDEDFEARLDEYRQIAVKGTGTDGLPAKTALKATTDSGAGPKPDSAVRDLFAMRRAGIDPRTL